MGAQEGCGVWELGGASSHILPKNRAPGGAGAVGFPLPPQDELDPPVWGQGWDGGQQGHGDPSAGQGAGDPSTGQGMGTPKEGQGPQCRTEGWGCGMGVPIRTW